MWRSDLSEFSTGWVGWVNFQHGEGVHWVTFHKCEGVGWVNFQHGEGVRWVTFHKCEFSIMLSDVLAV